MFIKFAYPCNFWTSAAYPVLRSRSLFLFFYDGASIDYLQKTIVDHVLYVYFTTAGFLVNERVVSDKFIYFLIDAGAYRLSAKGVDMALNIAHFFLTLGIIVFALVAY